MHPGRMTRWAPVSGLKIGATGSAAFSRCSASQNASCSCLYDYTGMRICDLMFVLSGFVLPFPAAGAAVGKEGRLRASLDTRAPYAPSPDVRVPVCQKRRVSMGSCHRADPTRSSQR